MIGFPVEVLSGRLTGAELLLGFAIQFAWSALALGLSWLTWRLGVKRYSAVGG